MYLFVHFKLFEWKRFFGLLIVPHISERLIFIRKTCGTPLSEQFVTLLRSFFLFVS